MLLADEKAPTDAPVLKTLFASDQEQPPQQGREAKMRITRHVTLRLATEHAYYIELSDKQILRLSAETVGGIIFDIPK
jgi:hypothetical protein